MEQKKIGEFIAAQRKEKQMTQKQLGEALGISDKAISKWECGKGLPDISIMMPLCELLEINVNELLSGEHLTEDYLYLTLFFTGHTKDFKNAFSFLRRRKPESIEEAQKAIMALSLAMKSLIIAGGFCTLFFSIYLLWLTTNSMDLSTFTANMAVTLIPFLYGLIGAAILIPVKGRLENRI